MSQPHRPHARRRARPCQKSCRRAFFEQLEDRRMLAAIAWISDTDGFWDEPENWDLNRVPNSGDDVSIDRGAANPTITIRDNREVQALNAKEAIVLSGGQFRVNGASEIGSASFTIDGGDLIAIGPVVVAASSTLHWKTGSIFGGGVANTGTILIEGSADKRLGGKITNSGTVQHGGTGNLLLDGSTIFDNLPNGVYEFDGEVAIRRSGHGAGFSSFVQNAGTLRKTGEGTAAVEMPLENLAGFSVDVHAGRLQLSGGGLWRDGTFTVAVNSVAEIGGSDQTPAVSGEIQGMGAGRVEITAPNIHSVDAGVSGAHAIFDFVPGLLHWIRGNIGSGGCGSGVGCGTTFVNRGFMTLSGTDRKSISSSGLINEGTMILQGPGDFGLNGATFTNRERATFELQGDAGIPGRDQFGNAGTFNNAGVIRKTSGTNPAILDARLNNSATGTVVVHEGTLRMNAGGTSTGGTFEIATDATLEFSGTDVFQWGGRYTGNGPGRILLNSLLNGSGDNPAVLAFSSGDFQIIGGQLLGSIVNEGVVRFSPPDGLFARAGIRNVGTWIHDGSGDFVLNANSRFINEGLYDVQTDADLVVPGDASGGTMYFLNSGTLRKSGGLGETRFRHDGFSKELRFSNTGIVEALAGTLAFEDPVDQAQGNTLTDGTWIAGPFATLSIRSAGDITVNRGHIVLDGPSSEFSNIAKLASNHGTFAVRGGREFSTVGPLTNSGRITTGAAGSLIVNGNYAEVTTNSLVGWWRGEGDAANAVGGAAGTIVGDVAFPPGQFGQSFGLDAQRDFVRLGNPPELRLQDFTLSAWVKRDSITVGGSILLYGFNGYGFGVIGDGKIFLTQTGISHVDSGAMQITDTEFHHVAVTKSGGTVTFYLDGVPSSPIAYRPNFGFFTDVAIGSRADANDPAFAGRIDEVAVFNRPLDRTEVQRLATTNNLSPLGRRGPALELEVAGRPATDQFGQVNILGQATLLGTLEIARPAGFGPTMGDAYELLTFTGRAGDFTDVRGHDPFFDVVTTETAVTLQVIASAGDLAVESVATPTPGTALVGQQLQLSYTVRNLAEDDLAGTWTDSVFLSSDRILSSDDVLVRRITRTSAVPADASYTESFSATVPGLIDDDYYVIVVANADKAIPELARGNNQAISSGQVQVEVPLLPFDTSVAGTLEPGGARYFRLELPEQIDDAVIRLQTEAANAGLELYGARGRLPTPFDFEFASGQLNSSIANATIIDAEPEPYFLLARARSLSAPASFTIEAEPPAIAFNDVLPRTVGAGVVTLHLFGANLRSDDVVELVGADGERIAAFARRTTDPNNLFVTFDLSAADLGIYDLEVTRQAAVLSLPDSIQLEAAKSSPIEPILQLPPRFRTGLVFNGAIVYENTSNVDIPAPFFVLSTDQEANLRLLRTDPFSAEDLLLIGASHQGPAGVLRPGEEWRIPFQPFTATASEIPFALDYQTADAGDAVDWEAIESSVRPAGTPDEEWDRYWVPFVAAAGNTVGGYVALMARYATEAQERGQNFLSARAVLQLAMRDLYERANARIAGRVFLNDSTHPLVNATVIATSVDGKKSIAVRTSSDGSFHIPELSAGTYHLTVPEHLVVAPVPIVVPEAGSVADRELTVVRGGVVRGTVRQQSNDVRLENVTVTLSGSTGIFVVNTDPRGEFSISGLPLGIYQMAVGSLPWEVESIADIEIDNLTRIRTIQIALQPAATVHGTVHVDGVPAAGASVSILDDDGFALRTVITSANGTYTIPGVTPGTVRIVAHTMGRAFGETSLTVAAGQDAAAPVISLSLPAQLDVTILDDQSDPLADAVVRVSLGDVYAVVGVTDSNGVARFSGLPSGNYTIHAAPSGFFASEEEVTLAAGANSETLILDPAGSVQGRVTDGAGVPIAEIQVRVFNATEESEEVLLVATTDADGNYAIHDLPFGSFAVTVGNGPGILRQNTVLDGSSRVSTVDFVVPGSSIVGHLFGADTLPVEDAEVHLIVAGELVAIATTNVEGVYRFRGLRPGSYTMQAGRFQGVSAVQEVTVAADTNHTVAPFAFGNLAISGKILANGQPLSGADVMVIPVAAPELAQYLIETTDAAGGYTVMGLSPGEYLIQASKRGFVAVQQTKIVAANEDVDFNLVEGISVGGTVTADGQPVEGADVLVTDRATNIVVAAGGTDSTGRYVVTDLPVGTFDVLVRDPRFQSLEIADVAIVSAVDNLDFTLVAKSTQLDGMVRDDNGQPLAFVQVELRNSRDVTVAVVQTARDGSYSLDSLPPGDYTLRGRLLGYLPSAIANVTLQAAVPQSVDFELAVAGTDDAIFMTTTMVSQMTAAIYDYFEEIQELNPPAERDAFDNFPALTLPTRDDCAEKHAAYDRALAAERNKDAAFEAWESAHQNFNTTYLTSAGILSVQLANVYGSIAGILANSLARTTFAGVSALRQGASAITLAGLQMTLIHKQLTKVYEKSAKILGDHPSGKKVLELAKALPKLLAEIGESNHLIDTVGHAGHAHHGPPIFATIIALDSLYQLANETKASADAIERLGSTVLDARDNYLGALDQYIAAREAYSRVSCSPEDPPPPTPRRHGPRVRLGNRQSADPNDKLTIGSGSAAWVRPGTTIEYTIRFENVATATAAAQQVVITDTLSPLLDLETIELLEVGFNGVTLEVPAGRNQFEAITHVASDPNPVQVVVELNRSTRTLTWTMTSIDPETQLLTEDPEAGFLPPNDVSRSGEGFVTFTVRSLPDLESGEVIENGARIVFDVNDPIDTPTISNTIDDGLPTSSVAPLPETIFTLLPQIPLTFQREDDVGGSGVATLDVFVSKDDGPWEILLSQTTEASHLFTGERGHKYAFYSVATDFVGHIEAQLVAADTETLVFHPPWRNMDNPLDVNGDGVVVPQDALIIINQLNDPTILGPNGALPLPPPALEPQKPFYDVSGDNFVVPLDVLLVINFLNSQGAPEGESLEASSAGSITLAPAVHPLLSGMNQPIAELLDSASSRSQSVRAWRAGETLWPFEIDEEAGADRLPVGQSFEELLSRLSERSEDTDCGPLVDLLDGQYAEQDDWLAGLSGW